MNDIPDIIFTSNPSSGNVNRGTFITVSCRQFVKLLKKENSKLIFSGYSPSLKKKEYPMFLLKEGFIINAISRDTQFLEKFFNIEQLNCNDIYEYLEIKFYKIRPPYYLYPSDSSGDIFRDKKAGDILREFKESNYYGVEIDSFKQFIKGKMHFFDNKQEFVHATRLGIDYKEEYDAFKQSGYQNYNDYLEAKEGDFEDRTDYYKAKELGLKTYKEYLDFLNKGFKDYLDKIKEIDSDAKKAYREGRREDYVRLKYLSSEKRGEVLYYKIFDREISQKNELNLTQIISAIEEKLNVKLSFNDALNNWRIKRNDIVHEHLKIDKNTVEEAMNFFKDYDTKLDELFSSWKPN